MTLDINRQRIAVRTLNATPNMGITRWRELINQLAEQQAAEAQSSMFADTLTLVAQVVSAAEKPSKGYKAITGAAAGRHLPKVVYAPKDRSMGRIFDRYILALREAGYTSEAAALANVYNVFVAMGWVFVPSDALLPQLAPTASAGDELHGELME